MSQPTSTSSTAARSTITARDVRDLQRRVRAFTSSGALQVAPTSYHR